MSDIVSAAYAIHMLLVQLELHELVAFGRDLHLVLRGDFRVESLW